MPLLIYLVYLTLLIYYETSIILLKQYIFLRHKEGEFHNTISVIDSLSAFKMIFTNLCNST